MNTGMQLTNATPRLERAFGVEFGRLLRADRQIVDHHVGAGLAQHRDDLVLGRLALRRRRA